MEILQIPTSSGNATMSLTDKLKQTVIAHRVPIMLIFAAMAMFAFIESRHPFFFLQDDNRDQNLPYYVHNIRAIAGGEFPLFNFHQHLGTPIFSCMQSAALYPVNYLALCMSQLVFGNYFGAIEFIAALHLIIAVTGFYYLTRSFGLSDAGCCFGAIAWGFCGFVFSVADSWIIFIGYAAWLPWMLLFSIRQIFYLKRRNFLCLVFIRVLAVFVGHPQLVAYVFLFDLVTVCLLRALLHNASMNSTESCIPTPLRVMPFAVQCLANYICVLVLSLPLLLPVLHQLGLSKERSQSLTWEEYSEFPYEFVNWLQGLFAPLAEPYHKVFCNQHMISHIGYLTILSALIALLTVKSTSNERRRYIFTFLLVGICAFLWATNSVVLEIIYNIPVLNRFRAPFKLVFFTSFSLIIIGTFGFDLLFTQLRKICGVDRFKATTLLWILFIIHCGNFLLLYSVSPQQMFSRHFDVVPFYEPLKNELIKGRIVSVAVDEFSGYGSVVYGNSAPLLGFNYATLLGLYHFGGYEVLLSGKNAQATLGLNYFSLFYPPRDTVVDVASFLPIEYLRKWGVKWYIFYYDIPLVNFDGLIPAYRDQYRKILYDPLSRPFVYWHDTLTSDGLMYHFGTNRITIQSERPTDSVVDINVLYNPFFNVTIDGMKAVLAENDDSQMTVNLPAGQHNVIVQYSDPFFHWGAIISGLFVVALLCSGWLMSDKTRAKQALPHSGN